MKFDLSIVGFGPRGLHALESFLITLSRKRNYKTPKVCIFESSGELGTGEAWRTDQPDSNWNNISDRNLENLEGRDEFVLEDLIIPSFPSFMEWCKEKFDHEINEEKDHYFKRSTTGQYLNERALSICDILKTGNILTIYKTRVNSLTTSANECQLQYGSQQEIATRFVLLCLGHLKTVNSPENKKFLKHAGESKATFILDLYSKESLDYYKRFKRVAIKGMGLAMIDVVRMCVDTIEGNFRPEGDIFLKFTGETGTFKIAPYSLNGLPPIPKPVGRKVDELFTPAQDVIDKFKQTIKSQINDRTISIKFLLERVAAVATDLYLDIENIDNSLGLSRDQLNKLLVNWYKDPTTESSLFINPHIPTNEYMREFCLMAYGKGTITLDYVAGQTWRHLQPTLYTLFAHPGLSADFMEELVKIDTQSKPHTYGPPVESILQLIALEEAGILTFEFADQPDVKLLKDEFLLVKDEKTLRLDCVVNSVLADPVLEKINDSLVDALTQQGLAIPVTKMLAIDTNSSAAHQLYKGSSDKIYSLGRITKGSVLGTDAILECFGENVGKWSKNFTEHYVNSTD
ncbi:MAG: FAD/NAD(P)-binding protein [Nonlabens sp.]